MAKLVDGMPAENSNKNTKSNYTLIETLLRQVQAINKEILDVESGTDLVADKIYTCDATVSDFTLPSAVENKGAVIVVVRTTGASGNTIITPFLGDKVNGLLNSLGQVDLDALFSKVEFTSLGEAGWYATYTYV